MSKMRLCSKCGISLLELKTDTFSCPRGHGSWNVNQGIRDRPVQHFNEGAQAYEAGAMEFTGGSKAGRKRKKPNKITSLINVFERCKNDS